MQFIDYGNGSAGAIASASGTVNTYATCTGSAGNATVTTGLSVSVNDQVLLHQSQGTGVGNWEVVKVLSTGAGSFTAYTTLINTYTTGAQAVKIPQYTSGTLSNSLTAQDWGASLTGGILALICNGTVTISGTPEVNGHTGATVTGDTPTSTGLTTGGGFRGSSGRLNKTSDFSCSAAEGYSSTSWNDNVWQYTPYYTGGGGPEVWAHAPTNGLGGGGGGNATAGTTGGGNLGQGNPGQGGGTGVSTASLSLAQFGGGGGGGGDNGDSGEIIGAGGSGGGFVLIIARTIIISGGLQANGGTGGQSKSGDGGSGGGGAGGCIQLICQNATLGSGLITATAGLGGAGSPTRADGGTGVIAVRYFNSITGTTSPSATTAQDYTLGDKGGAFMAFM